MSRRRAKSRIGEEVCGLARPNAGRTSSPFVTKNFSTMCSPSGASRTSTPPRISTVMKCDAVR
jgi:hypothetical protein